MVHVSSSRLLVIGARLHDVRVIATGGRPALMRRLRAHPRVVILIVAARHRPLLLLVSRANLSVLQ